MNTIKNIENYKENREENYLAIRDSLNKNYKALDFAVLTRTCYSRISRFQKRKGYTGTPIEPHNPIRPETFDSRVRI